VKPTDDNKINPRSIMTIISWGELNTATDVCNKLPIFYGFSNLKLFIAQTDTKRKGQYIVALCLQSMK
jgi:hypothetical protein